MASHFLKKSEIPRVIVGISSFFTRLAKFNRTFFESTDLKIVYENSNDSLVWDDTLELAFTRLTIVWPTAG